MKKIRCVLAIILVMALSLGAPVSSSARTVKVTITIRTKKKVYLEDKKVSIYKKDTQWLHLKNASNNVKWSSTRSSVVSVKKDKKDGNWAEIYAKKKGTATIKARYKGRTYRCKVKVKGKKKTAFALLLEEDRKVEISTTNFWSLKDSTEEVEFYTPLNNIALSYKVKNPEYISCKWGEWHDDDYLTLYITPKVKKNVKTSVTITNSYNGQKMVIPVTITYEEI